MNSFCRCAAIYHVAFFNVEATLSKSSTVHDDHGFSSNGRSLAADAAPIVVEYNPIQNSVTVPVSTDIQLFFNEDIAAGSAGSITLIPLMGSSNIISVSDSDVVTISGSNLTIDPKSDLFDSMQYALNIPSGVIVDGIGNPFAGLSGSTYSFTTLPVDSTPPVITSLSPIQNATLVSVFSPIVLTFSESVVTRTGSITLTSSSGEVTTVDVSGDQVNVTNNVVTISLSAALLGGVNYRVRVPLGAIVDPSSNPFADLDNGEYEFYTMDLTAMVIVNFDPPAQVASNDSAVALDANITLQFSERIVKASGIVALTPSSGAGMYIALQDESQVSISDHKLIITPFIELLDSVEYRVTMPFGVIIGSSGNEFAGLSDSDYTFTTRDVTGPKLVTAFPLNNSQAVQVASSLVLTFSEWVIAGQGKISLTPSSGPATIINASDPRVTISGNTITVDPIKGLLNWVTYTVRIAPGAFSDTNGNVWEGIHHFPYQFSVAEPLLLGCNPVKKARDVLTSTNLVLTFSEPVTIGDSRASIILTSSRGTVTSISISGNQVKFVDNTLIINPRMDLSDSVQYVVTVARGTIVDWSGNEYIGLSTGSYTFTTVDLTAPVITSYSPVQNEREAWSTLNIILTFSESVIAGAGDITLTPAVADSHGKVMVPKSPTVIPLVDKQVSISGNVLTINPSLDLQHNFLYTFTMPSDAVFDSSGNAFGGISGTMYQFTVVDSPPHVVMYSPTHNAVGVATSSSIIFTFSEDIVLGKGHVRISSSRSHLEGINMSDSRVTILSRNLTIRPIVPFDDSAQYTIGLDEGVVVDKTGKPSVRLSGSQYQFRTEDLTSPKIESYRPSQGALGVSPGTDVALTFNEQIFPGTGNITFTRWECSTQIATQQQCAPQGGSPAATLPISQMDISNRTVKINSIWGLLKHGTYAVTMDSGVIVDSNRNPFAGLEGSVYNFTVVSPSSTISTTKYNTAQTSTTSPAPSSNSNVNADPATGGHIVHKVWLTHNFPKGISSGTLMSNTEYITVLLKSLAQGVAESSFSLGLLSRDQVMIYSLSFNASYVLDNANRRLSKASLTTLEVEYLVAVPDDVDPKALGSEIVANKAVFEESVRITYLRLETVRDVSFLRASGSSGFLRVTASDQFYVRALTSSRASKTDTPEASAPDSEKPSLLPDGALGDAIIFTAVVFAALVSILLGVRCLLAYKKRKAQEHYEQTKASSMHRVPHTDEPDVHIEKLKTRALTNV